MKIILYGLGRGLDEIKPDIKKEHEIIGYTDTNSRINIFCGKPFFRLTELNRQKFDYIIITIKTRQIAWNIYKMLSCEYNIPDDKIIPYFVYYHYENYRAQMDWSKENKIKGLFFGNSHAARGFTAEQMSIPFLNLGFPNQDIFYNYRTFQLCVEKYADKLSKLKYVVIDMYDYNVFNLDLSLEKDILVYIAMGGLCEQHNYEKNHNYNRRMEEELFDSLYYIVENEKTRQLYQELFENNTVPNVYADERWKCIEEKVTLDADKFIGNVVVKRFDDTIKENEVLFEQFLMEIKRFKPDIKIILTLLPRYITMEKVAIPFLSVWKQEFLNTINRLKEKYGVVFWDYKQYECISGNHEYFWDVNHLNTIGAKCMTSILDTDIRKFEETYHM